MFSMDSMGAGGGIEAVESRIQQIESMLKTSPPVPPSQPVNNSRVLNVYPSGGRSFQSYLKPEGLQTLKPLVDSMSQQYGLDKNLVNAVVQQESGYNPAALSKSGAMGLMQLMPGTAQELGVSNPRNPVENLDGGIRYLKGLLERFNGNVPLALAAYNAGPAAVAKYKGIPPYAETQHYVRSILSNYLQAQQQESSQS